MCYTSELIHVECGFTATDTMWPDYNVGHTYPKIHKKHFTTNAKFTLVIFITGLTQPVSWTYLKMKLFESAFYFSGLKTFHSNIFYLHVFLIDACQLVYMFDFLSKLWETGNWIWWWDGNANEPLVMPIRYMDTFIQMPCLRESQ